MSAKSDFAVPASVNRAMCNMCLGRWQLGPGNLAPEFLWLRSIFRLRTFVTCFQGLEGDLEEV